MRTCKCLLAAGDDYSANALIFVILGEGLVEFLEKRATQGIESFWSVKSD